MSEAVSRFIEEFEEAIENVSRHAEWRPLADRAIRQVERLRESLDRLSGSGFPTVTITSDDLRTLVDELSTDQRHPDLAGLVTKASALITVVEEGIVDGDVDRLRDALSRAAGISRSGSRSMGDGERRLASRLDMETLEGRTFTHRSKDGERTLTVVDGRWKLDDGTEHASPTAAAIAVVGKRTKINGRKYWKVSS